MIIKILPDATFSLFIISNELNSVLKCTANLKKDDFLKLEWPELKRMVVVSLNISYLHRDIANFIFPFEIAHSVEMFPYAILVCNAEK